MRALDFAGVDISFYQAAISLDGYADAHELIILKASEGATITDPCLAQFAQATQTVKYRGFYHFLTHADPAAQIERFAQSVQNRYWPNSGDFIVIDWEKSKVNGVNVEVPREIAYAVIEGVQRLFPQKPVWVYSYRSLLFREAAYLHPYPLWVASYDVLEDAISLGAVIDQYGVATDFFPFYGGQIDVNRVLDPARLHELTYGSTPASNPEDDTLNPISYHDNGDRTQDAKETSAEAALGWAVDSAAQAEMYARSAATTAAQVLAAINNLPAQPSLRLSEVSTQALLAELARRVTS